MVLIGNLDPVRVMLNLTPPEIYQRAIELLNAMESVPNFILSSGCDLPPATPLENIEAFCQAAEDYNCGTALE